MEYNRARMIEAAPSISKELSILFKTNPPSIIFDIGACEGESSIQYSRLFPNSKIFAFEPLPSNIELIKSNLSKYGISNVSHFNKALSDRNGLATFHVSNEITEEGGKFISKIKVIWLEVSKINFYKNQPLVDEVKEFMRLKTTLF